jgi:hypothetical protein
VAAYWVENNLNEINAIPQIARLAPVEDRFGDIRGEIIFITSSTSGPNAGDGARPRVT